jgi:hypothetical protein
MKKIFLLICGAVTALLAGCATPQYVAVGPNWQALYNAPEGGAAKVSVAAAKDRFTVGEKMSFTVESDKSGKLWLITVGPDDAKRLVFPNSYATDNSIEGGKAVQLPGDMESWSLRAADPLGENLVVAIVTGRDAQVEDVGDLLMSPDFTKAIALNREPLKYGLANTVITVAR